MKTKLPCALIMIGLSTLALLSSGCSRSSSGPGEGQAAGAPPTVPGALSDSRIPPERRAAIEQAISQQKATADRMGGRMAAANHSAAPAASH